MGISYFDVWKKRMDNNGDIVESRLNNSKSIFNNSFKDDPSYKLAKLKSKENTEEIDLDTRIINNEENPLEKKIYVRPDTNINVGDYIIYPNITYLVLKVETNLISPRADSTKCNQLLKWMYKGELYETMSITSNATKYTEGTKAIGESIVEIQARYSVTIPYNEKTKTISIGIRFIINNIAWEVTQTDFTTDVGLLVLTLGKSSINNETDDIVLGIADYKTVKHDYKFNIPSSFNVTKDDTYTLVYSIQDNLKDIDYNLVDVEYIGNLIQVEKNGKDIIITGKELGFGNIKMKANLNNEVKEFNINFNVIQNVVNEIKYDIQTSNGYTYRIKEGSTITAIKYINGVIQNNLIIEYQLDSIGQTLLSKNNISIVKKTDSSFTIKNLTINTLTTFYLTVVDKTTGDKILDNQIITLKGM